MKHFLITRFNYPEDYEHLEERIKLFNQYTRPSIEAQTSTNFEWLILGNPPIDLSLRMKTIPGDATDGVIKKHTKYGYMEYIKEQTKNENLVLMTRLDNDDMLMPRYIQDMQAKVSKPGLYEFKGYRLDLRNGLFYKDKIYGPDEKHKFITSPFLTLARRPKTLETVYSHNHSKMWRYYALTIFPEIRWVQIIHQTNWLLNRPSCIALMRRGIQTVPPPLVKKCMGIYGGK